MIHYAAPDFWACYRALPPEIQILADRAFAQLKADPNYPSLHFKKAGAFWSSRVGLHYRALAVECRTVCFGFGSEPTRSTIVWSDDRNLPCH